MNEPATIQEMLHQAKTIAVVGLSASAARPSFGVSAYMQRHGYRIIPVNPAIEQALGEQSYAALADIPDEIKIDLVNVFRTPEAVPAIVEEVLRLKVRYLWLQETVIHEDAARRAEAAGVKVVMDRCILKDHRKYMR